MIYLILLKLLIRVLYYETIGNIMMIIYMTYISSNLVHACACGYARDIT